MEFQLAEQFHVTPKVMDTRKRYNGILRILTQALITQCLYINQWKNVLQQTLHSICTLLSIATNATPYERRFNYPRWSSSCCTVSTRLSTPGNVLLKWHVRQSNYDPIVEEVELIEANPRYAHIRLQNGKETTVSLQDLAPAGLVQNYSPEIQNWLTHSKPKDLR